MTLGPVLSAGGGGGGGGGGTHPDKVVKLSTFPIGLRLGTSSSARSAT